ncbi:hypothetical protein ACCS81_38995, partial [Rhizobium ruizarguesonis]
QLAAANFGTSIYKLPVKWNGILTAMPEPEEPLFNYTTDLIELRQKTGGFPMQTQRLTRILAAAVMAGSFAIGSIAPAF